MASNKLQVSDFDFDDIKANLKSFLQDQSELPEPEPNQILPKLTTQPHLLNNKWQ